MKRKNSRGIALIAVLLIMMAMFVLTMGFIVYTTTDYTVSQTYQTSTTAFYLAKSGLEYVHYLVKHNMLIFPLKAYNGKTVGQVENVFCYKDSTSVHNGSEQMLISSLTWGTPTDSLVYQALGNNHYIGTFHVKVVEQMDDYGSNTNTDYRALYVTSIGKIREVTNLAKLSDPSSIAADIKPGDSTFETNYPVRAKRTLVMRIPFHNCQLSTSDLERFRYFKGGMSGYLQGDHYSYWNYIDSWFEKFR